MHMLTRERAGRDRSCLEHQHHLPAETSTPAPGIGAPHPASAAHHHPFSDHPPPRWHQWRTRRRALQTQAATLGAARSSTLRQGAIKIRNNIVVLSILCFSTACAQTELVDAQLREAGLRLGASSVALTQLPVDAPPDAFEDQLSSISEQLSILAIGHDAAGLSSPDLPTLAATPLEPTDERLLEWDGQLLEVNLDGLGSGDVRALGSVRLQGYRYDNPQWQGTDACFWGTPTGNPDGSVECPPFIDRALTFTRPAQGLTVHATFGVTLDGDRCAAGGQVELDYVFHDADSPRGGTLEASYEGCERIRILSPK